MVEDKSGGNGRDRKQQQRMRKLTPLKHNKEARPLQDGHKRRKDCHAENVPQVPGAKECKPGAGFDEEQCPRGAKSAGNGRRPDYGNAKKADKRAALGEIERSPEPVRE
jgi:hypothetical protein